MTTEERVWVCRKDPWRVGEGVEETGRGRLVGGSRLEHRFLIEEPLEAGPGRSVSRNRERG